MRRFAVIVAIVFGVVGLSAVGAEDDTVPSETPPATVLSPSETPPTAVLEAETARVEVMDRAKDAVLAVFASSGRGGGSGVVISADGYALTNFHVVKPCGNAMKCGMADGKIYDAVLVGVDPTGDVALIKLLGRDDFPAAELGDSDRLQVGDWCFAMGNPFLLATDFQPTVTFGIVSGTHRYQYPAGTLLEYADCIQTDASINPGNSGGPLFDGQGCLIGINGRGSFEKRGRVNVGVAYAISINQIKNFMGYLHSGRIVDHATLGAQVSFDAEGRVVVDNILDYCDAYRRGLRLDDEVVSFGGRPISTPNGFKNALGIYPKGWRIPMSYRRDGERYDVHVRLRSLHREEELLQKTTGRAPRIQVPPPKPGEEDPDGKKEDGKQEEGKEEKKPDESDPGGEPGAEEPKSDEEPKPDEQPKSDEEPKSDEQPKSDDEPKPDEEPKSDEEPKPDEQPKPQPRQIPVPRPGHPPIRVMRPGAPMPEEVKKHFEEKRGFANYYFNKLNRQRVWDAWSARADFAGLRGKWTLRGESSGGKAFTVELTDDDARLKLPLSDFAWKTADGFALVREPQGSGGLLPALHLWRRLALLGPEKFGEVTYLGTMPLVGRDGLVDALIAEHEQAECRFLFDPDEGHLLAVEFFSDEDEDPCEVYFSEFRETDGRWLPGQMEVRFGDAVYGIFKLDEFALEKSEDQ